MDENKDLEKKALNIIKFSNQFRKILKQKLLSKNFESTQIDLLLDRFEEMGLINDYVNGLNYARELINNNFYGKNIVIKKLYEKIEDKELINKIISEIYSEYSDEDTCNKYINKKMKIEIIQKENMDKILKRLTNHGFDFKTIKSVLKYYEE